MKNFTIVPGLCIIIITLRQIEYEKRNFRDQYYFKIRTAFMVVCRTIEEQQMPHQQQKYYVFV